MRPATSLTFAGSARKLDDAGPKATPCPPLGLLLAIVLASWLVAGSEEATKPDPQHSYAACDTVHARLPTRGGARIRARPPRGGEVRTPTRFGG
jgi:hypothetical protein